MFIISQIQNFASHLMSAGRLKVDAVVSSSGLPAGSATSANQTTEIGHLATIAGKDFSTSAKQDTGNTSLASIKTNTDKLNGTLGDDTATPAQYSAKGWLSAILTKLGAVVASVTGTVTANAGTNLNTSALALETTLTAIKDTAGIKKVTDPVAVTTVKPDGTNTQPSGDTAARAAFVNVVDRNGERPDALQWGAAFDVNQRGWIQFGLRTATLTYFPLPSAAKNDTVANKGERVIPVVPVYYDYGTATNHQIMPFDTAAHAGFTKQTDGTTTLKYASAGADVQGASPQTLLAAGAAGIKNRIHTMTISADTAGLVTVSNGIGRFYLAANTPVSIQWLGGKVQTTAATAITVTNAGGGNVAAECTYNTE